MKARIIIWVFTSVPIVFLIMPCYIYAQSPDTAWTKIFGGNSDDVCNGVEATPDGGCVLVGSTKSFGCGENDILLIKVDAQGNIDWMRTYGGILDDHGYSVKITADSGYIIVGETYSFGSGGSDVYIIKTDSIGDTLWTQVIGGPFDDRGNAAANLDDNSIVVAATSKSFAMDSSDMIIIKIEPAGNVVWSNVHDIRDYDRAVDIDVVDDGYYLFGNVWDTTASGMCLLRLDNNGEVIWTKCYDPLITTGTFDAAALITMPNNGSMLMFSSSRIGHSKINVIFADCNGDTLWWRSYGEGIYDTGRSIVRAGDGNVLIGGDCVFIPEDSLYMAKIDVNGNLVWEVSYGFGGYLWGGFVEQSSDDGLFLAGTKFIPDDDDLCLIKYRSESNIEESQNLTEKPSQISTAPNPFSRTTVIHYTLSTMQAKETNNALVIHICDATGRIVKRFFELPNYQLRNYQVIWDGRDTNGRALPNGIYFIVVATPQYKTAGEVILIR